MWNGYGNSDHQGWGMMNDGGAGAWVSLVLMLAVLVALVVTAVLVLRHTRPALPGAGPASVPPAQLLLDERFARGEIDEDEYRHRRTILLGG